MKYLIFAALLYPLSVNAQCKDDDSFNRFFREFREYVRKVDVNQVARLTSFPFKARAEIETEKPFLVSKTKFLKYYKYMMKMQVETNEKNPKKISQKDILLADLPIEYVARFTCEGRKGKSVLNSEVDIGQLGFKRDGKGKWHLVDGYLGDLFSYVRDNEEPAP